MTPIWASRRDSSAGARTCWASSSTPSGSAGSDGSMRRRTSAWARPDRPGLRDHRPARPERTFEAFLDRKTVDDAGPEILGVNMEQPGERLGFGIDTMHAALGLDERRAGDIERLAGGRMRSLGADRGAFRLGHLRLGLCDGDRKGLEIRPALRVQVASSASTAAVSVSSRVLRSLCSRTVWAN